MGVNRRSRAGGNLAVPKGKAITKARSSQSCRRIPHAGGNLAGLNPPAFAPLPFVL